MTDIDNEEGAEPTEAEKRGRPSKYRPEFAEKAKRLCELGATDADLALIFDVTTVTIWRWQAEHAEFCNAVRAGKEPADSRVERALYLRAVGYSYSTEKVFCTQGLVTKVPVVEHTPPEVGAALNWLANRCGDRWRLKQSLEHTGKDGTPLMPEANSRDVARAVLDLLRSARVEGAADEVEDDPDAGIADEVPTGADEPAPAMTGSPGRGDPPRVRKFNPATGRLED